MQLNAPCEPVTSLLVAAVTSGYASYRLGNGQTGPTFVSPHWSGFQVEWDDVVATMGIVDLDEARPLGAGLSGLDPSEVTFSQMEPVSPDAARYLRSVLLRIEHNLLANDTMMASPLVRADAFRQLATAAFVTFPNTALDRLTDTTAPGAGRAEPATVRRAVEFIDAHAQELIDITQIAAAARVPPRTLQAAFRRHRDQTPLEYLRGVRFEGSHRDLETGDPTRGDTVAAIATRWGFTHHGRFSVQYRRAYGCSPGDTLRS